MICFYNKSESIKLLVIIIYLNFNRKNFNLSKIVDLF